MFYLVTDSAKIPIAFDRWLWKLWKSTRYERVGRCNQRDNSIIIPAQNLIKSN